MLGATADKVGNALALLREGLAPYVSGVLHEAVEKGELSMAVLRRLAEDPMLADRKVEDWDVAPLTRAMRMNWHSVFSSRLERRTRTLLHEVADIRNAWAHQQLFNEADTERALDTVQRLLVAVGAAQAKAVQHLKHRELPPKRDLDPKSHRRCRCSPGSLPPSFGGSHGQAHRGRFRALCSSVTTRGRTARPRPRRTQCRTGAPRAWRISGQEPPDGQLL